jgi:hypothetical protein
MSGERAALVASPAVSSANWAASPVRQPIDTVGLVCFVFFFIGVYTDITIYSGAQPVIPDVISSISAAVFVVIRREELGFEALRNIALLTALVLFLYLATSLTHGFLSAKSFNGTVNMIIAWAVGYAGFTMMRVNSRRTNAILLATIWVSILIGAAVELAGPLRPVSDAFRLYAYRYQVLNSDVTRDVGLYGSYRPKVFTSEPSLVGIWFSVTICAWLLLYPVRLFSRRTIVFLVALALMFYIQRSPTILFCVPVLACGLLAPNVLSSDQSGIKPYWLLIGTCAALIGVGAFFVLMPTNGLFQFMQGGSFYFRMIAPPGLTAQVIEKYPLFGIGLANQELLSVEATTYFMGHYNGAMDVLSVQTSALNIVANSFFLHWIFAGAVGGILLILAYLRLFRSMGLKDPYVVLACAFLLWSTMGGYVVIKVWAVAFILAGARYLLESEQSAEDRMNGRAGG